MNASELHGANDSTLISGHVDRTIISLLFVILGLSLSISGIVTNVINIIVYIKQGIKDSISVQFLLLSVSNLIYCVFNLTVSATAVIGEKKPDYSSFDADSLVYALTPIRTKWYAISILLTMLLSIERCCCVVLPFKVKMFFTKQRAVCSVVIIAVGCLSWLVPEYLTVGLRWRYDPRFNETRLLLWEAENHMHIDVAKYFTFSVLLPIMGSITLTICASLMIAALKSSRKVRSSTLHVVSDGFTNVPERGESTGILSLSSKEVRLAKTVVAVDLLFIMCNIPKCMAAGLKIVVFLSSGLVDVSLSSVPDTYRNLIWILTVLAFSSESINCSVNLIIYYINNSKFRTTMNQLLCTSVPIGESDPLRFTTSSAGRAR